MVEAAGEKLKLLVVDDEPDNLDLLHRTFRKEFQVFKANSGLKALEVLAEVGEMAVIISDQRMPKMNGTEFLSHTIENFPDTIRILLTGYTDAQDLVGAINAGKVFKYITKPWQFNELQLVVQQAADTYRVVKRRTNELNRALRRESIFNAVTTAIRESLDYCSMRQRVVDTIGQTFAADVCVLYPIECINTTPKVCHIDSQIFTFTANPQVPEAEANGVVPISKLYPPTLEDIHFRLIEFKDPPAIQLIVPLTYLQDRLAILILYKQGSTAWSKTDIQLIQEVAEQAALAISQAKLYQQIQQQTEQMQSELAVARQIQMNLLRQSWSTAENVRVQAQCHPAREIGGDFFEVYVHPQGDIWLAVGDVSGKGVPAALFMASAISLLRRELSQEIPPEPNVVLSNMNASLSEELISSNCFITMVLARYSPASYELVYANAGHIYPIVWSREPVQVTAGKSKGQTTVAPSHSEPNYLKVRSIPLGILPHWKAAAGTLTLKAGEVLLLTSDGITEATITAVAAQEDSPTGLMLKQSGLWQLLTQQQGMLNLSELLATIQAHTSIQEDDQTILSLEVL